ncbi:cellulase [Trifolium repens]|nr:cellulase [Trifolium repens]
MSHRLKEIQMILSKSVANRGRVANQTSFPEALPLLKSLSLHFEVGYAQDFDSWYNRIFAKLQSSFVNTGYYHNELPLPQQKASIITRIND